MFPGIKNNVGVATLTADYLCVGSVFKMAIHDLLSEGERAAETLSHDCDVLVEPFVVDELVGLKLAVGNVGEGGGGSKATGSWRRSQGGRHIERAKEHRSPARQGRAATRDSMGGGGGGAVVFERCVWIFRSFDPIIRVRLGATARQTSKRGSARARIFMRIFVAIIHHSHRQAAEALQQQRAKHLTTNDLLPQQWYMENNYRNSVLNE